MTQLVPLPADRGLVVRTNRQLAQQLQAIDNQALVVAARQQARSLAGRVALMEVAALSAIEAELIKQVPLGAERFKTIVDAAAIGMAAELQMMRWT